MRKIIAVLASILILFTSSGCRSKEAEKNCVYPPFFVVKDEATGGEVYMLGSMHVGLPNTVYPEEIYDAINSSSEVACEIDLIELEKNQDEVTQAMKVFECSSAKEYMGEDYEEIKAFFAEKGLYNPLYEKYIPAMWSIMLSNKAASDSGYDSLYGTDREILTYAKNNGKKIVELETAAEQYRINAEQSPALQIYILKSSVNLPYNTLLSQNTMLYNAWSNNYGAVLEMMLSTSGVPEELADDYNSYFEEMYEKRQEKMAKYVTETLKNGRKSFMVVGAAHYYAAPDIPDFIEKAGYTVEPVKFDE